MTKEDRITKLQDYLKMLYKRDGSVPFAIVEAFENQTKTIRDE